MVSYKALNTIYGIYILEIVFDDNRLTNMKIMKY